MTVPDGVPAPSGVMMAMDRKPPNHDGVNRVGRRAFLTAAAFTIVPSHVLGRGGKVAANSRVNDACVGGGSQRSRVRFGPGTRRP